ncbi:3-hydroxyacyl-CoA-dehydrogenase [Rhizoctonia solani AG-1 IA]|uniref:3-hydroxyacyl-CoA-dehydrogenase n=1 Tax=Thanatephorus cucumeris (strain AG1-IA) TaxID=983506 RepID=L8WPT6_THACA|nr:3-hydroxyacyl-CoA-dehydrogenase [Rhizoctonia solani AG-1 IA]
MFLVGTRREEAIDLTEDATTISIMLEFIYPNRQAPLVTSFETLDNCLRISQKYDLQSMIQTLDTQLSINTTPQSLVHSDPLRAYQLALTFDLPKTKVMAAPLITTAKADLCEPSRLSRVVQSHPSASLIRLIGIQGTRAKILADVLFGFYKRPMLPTQEHFFYDLSCEPCRGWLDMCEGNEARAGLYTHHPPSWLLSWSNLVYQTLLAMPIEQCDDLFRVTVLERLEGTATTCQDCLADFWKYRDQRPKFDRWASNVKTTLKERLSNVAPHDSDPLDHHPTTTIDSMPGRLEHKVAIVTGAGSGIGLESSLLFASEGAHVVLADINIDAANKTQGLLKEKYPNAPKALAVKVDVSKEADLKALVDKTVEEFGRLDVMTDESKKLHTGGSIINTASFVSLMGAATPQLAFDSNDTAHQLMGPFIALLMDFLNTEEKRNRRMVHLPMGRFGEAIEQAQAALFLASDESSYITGTDFKVDGGLSSCYVTAEGEPVLPPPVSLFMRATDTEKCIPIYPNCPSKQKKVYPSTILPPFFRCHTALV